MILVSTLPIPVSYTHLDVYKRQVPSHRQRRVDDQAHRRPSLMRSLIFRPPSMTPRRRARIQSRDDLAAARNDNLVTRFDPIEQLPKFVLRLEGSNFSHGTHPNSLADKLTHNTKVGKYPV